MAILKATYTKNSRVAKSSIKYIQHRKGKEGVKVSRVLFGIDGRMKREEAYQMIDEAKKGSFFFRFVISPDPRSEDIEKDLFLRQITESVMQALENRLNKQVHWVAAEHDDHAPHRHVHIVAIVEERLQVQDFQALRSSATDSCVLQRKERDFARDAQRARTEEQQAREDEQWERSV